MSVYTFRPFTRANVPMVARWLRAPEVVRWWGDPGEQIALVTEDLDEPLMQQWIARAGFVETGVIETECRSVVLMLFS